MIKLANIHRYLDYLEEADYVFIVRNGFIEIVVGNSSIFVY